MKKPFVSLLTQGLGKIIIGNQESSILSFPSTFKDGDIVDVKFRNNDINSNIINLIAYSKEYHYGFVINQFSSNKGIILITYPEIEGTVLFKSNLNQGDKVKFKIKKLTNGKIEAIDIKILKDEKFKANIPEFGKIEKKVIVPKEAVVEELVLDKEHSIGKIKVLKEDRGFGFITNDTGEDIYFKINMFKRVYKRTPKINEQVKFVAQNFNSKISVKAFMINTSLKESLQYGIVDGKRFTIQEYKKVFNQFPQLGDIVYYTNENSNFKFKETDMPTEKYIFKKDTNLTNVRNGQVSSVKENFGFIESGKDSIYFLTMNYKNTYKKEPKIGDNVAFAYKKSDKGFHVTKFSDSYVELNINNFKNFVNIDPTKIYYAYINKGDINEVYEYKSDNLNQSISCYKSTKDNLKKLEAIECIVKNEYSSKKLTKKEIIKDKLRLLDSLVDKNIKNNNYQKALYYESKYQIEKFDPSRLKKLSKIALDPIKFFEKKKIDYIVKSQYFDFIDIIKDLEIIKSNDYINIIEPKKIKKIKQNTPKYKFIIKD
jgi:cold shock CspA family protein